MSSFKKSDLKTGHILTFSDGLKGIVIKDVNGDPSQSLILYLSDRDETVDGYDYIDKVLDDDLHCYDGAFDVYRDLISVERLKNEYKLGSLLSPFDDDYATIDSIPKIFLLNRSRTLRVGDAFYIVKFSGSGVGDYDIGDYTIKDIYVEGTKTFLTTTSNQKVDVKDVYLTRTEAEEALKTKEYEQLNKRQYYPLLPV